MMLGPINLLPKISNNICWLERFLQKLEKFCLRMLVDIIKLEEDENKGACSSLFQLVPACSSLFQLLVGGRLAGVGHQEAVWSEF